MVDRPTTRHVSLRPVPLTKLNRLQSIQSKCFAIKSTNHKSKCDPLDRNICHLFVVAYLFAQVAMQQQEELIKKNN